MKQIFRPSRASGSFKESNDKAPNMNPFCEAGFRREVLDRFIVFGERHLDHLCNACTRYYNSVRAHSSLDNETTFNRDAQDRQDWERLTSCVSCLSLLKAVVAPTYSRRART